jgi:HK97 family phage portal protein
MHAAPARRDHARIYAAVNPIKKVWLAIRNAYEDLNEERYFSDFVPRLNTSGVHVDENSAMRCGAVFACVRVISQSIAALPWNVIEKDGDRRDVRESHPAHWLLHVQANPETTAFAWRECMLASALTFGDAYAEIERDRMNRPIWMHQIHPMKVQEVRTETGALRYRVRNNNGLGYRDIEPEFMFHLHGLSRDGVFGYNLINLAAQSIGLAIAMEEFGGAFFGNSAAPSGVFEAEPGTTYTEAQLKEFREQLDSIHRGTKNARRAMLAPKGMKWKQTSIAPNEGQFNESRQQQVEEIARWFGVPLHKIGHLLRSTNNNIEHQAIEFVTDCLVPWITRLEQEANIKLFGRAAQGRLYSKINVAGLLRGDAKAQADAFALGRQWGWLSVNDIRRLRDENPIGPEGDIYLQPMNMVPADMARELAKPKPAPQLPEPDQPEKDATEEPAIRENVNARILRVISYGQEQ